LSTAEPMVPLAPINRIFIVLILDWLKVISV
jgi:hypothetical protein